MKRIAAAALMVLATLAGQALAQQAGPWYGGLSAGTSSASIDSGALPIAGAPATSLSKDDSDTGFKIYGGYRFNRHFALEAGYTDLGTFGATRTVLASPGGTLRAETKVSGVHFDAVGILPLAERFSLFGKVGGYYNEVKTTLSTTGGVSLLPGVAASRSHSDVNLKYGIGAGFDFTERFGLRAEWERHSDLGDTSTTGTQGDVDLVSVGVVFRF